MRHIDLFSGIGGFALSASWVWPDHEVVCFCEMDPFCKKILNKHWPDVPIVEDVNDVERILGYTECINWKPDKTKQVEQAKPRLPTRGSSDSARSRTSTDANPTTTNVDLLTGGFPCQGFSVAGKQRGKSDDRYLWPQMLEIIKATRPRWVIGENVAGIIKMALDTVLSDLEAEGYTTRVFVLPACSKNAPHRRDRVWIVAHDGEQTIRGKPRGIPESENPKQEPGWWGVGSSGQNVADTDSSRKASSGGNRGTGWVRKSVTDTGEHECEDGRSQRRLGQSASRLPKRLDNPWGPGWEDGTPRVITGQKDRVNRLKALGNSIVPQVAYEIMMAIKESDNA
jgi:DNA (cytosine-5)-methyltransferase 1